MRVNPRIGSRPVTGYSFSTPVRVRFADTDAQGVAHNSA
jgi:acyl-CoA thioesterase FadM